MKRIAIAGLAMVIMALAASTAHAQQNLYSERLGSLFASPYEDRYVDVMDGNQVTAGVPFTVYLMADIDFGDIGEAGQNVNNGIGGWEAAVTFPAGVFLLATEKYPTETVLDFGSVSGSTTEYVIGTGSNIAVGTAPSKLIEWTILGSGAFDGMISLAPTAAPTVAGESSWLEFLALNGCIINNLPTPCLFRWESLGDLRVTTTIPSEASSFGSFKSRF